MPFWFAGVLLLIIGFLTYVVKKLRDTVATNRLLISNYELAKSWIGMLSGGKSIGSWARKNGYSRVAVYGYGIHGRMVVDQIENAKDDVWVEAIIDKKAHCLMKFINGEFYAPEEKLPEVDCLIVTPVNYYLSIKDDMEKRMTCPIVSLYDIVSD